MMKPREMKHRRSQIMKQLSTKILDLETYSTVLANCQSLLLEQHDTFFLFLFFRDLNI